MINNLEINKELVLSTAHVTQAECNNDEFFNYSSDEFNTRFHAELTLDDMVEKDLGNKYPNLSRLLELAKNHDCKWLVLDCDGIVHNSLKVFTW